MPAIGIFKSPLRNSGSRSWTPQSLGTKVLAWFREVDESAGEQPNKIDGGATVLTVTGSGASKTYKVPDTADFNDSASDKLWFDEYGIKSANQASLINFDHSRTLIKYDNLTGYRSIYNGTTVPLQGYGVGLAYSFDKLEWNRDTNNPIFIVGGSSAWDETLIRQPKLIIVGDTIYVFYSGLSAAGVYGIGLVTSADYGKTWTKHASNPVLTKGASTTWDDEGVWYPVILYEADAVAAKRWKMWYLGYDGLLMKCGYAYSADGISWTKFAGNPVITVGAGGSWEDEQIVPQAIYKENGTYYLYYGGYDGANYEVGLATFTDPEGTYTKSANNPVVERRNTATQSLTGNTLTGSAIVTVADTSVFEENEYIILYDNDSSTGFVAKIQSIDTGTQLTLDRVVTSDFTTAQSALIVSIYANKLTPSSIYKEGSQYVMMLACFGLHNIEITGFAYSNSLDSKFTIDFDKGVALEGGGNGTWDNTSVENMDAIPLQFYLGSSLMNGVSLVIKEIVILKAGETLTSDETDKLSKYLELSKYWSGSLNSNGVVKANRGNAKNTFYAYDIYYKSILHFEGADDSVVFTDDTGKIWTPYGTAKIDRGEYKFGVASGLFDGNSDYIDTPNHIDFNPATGNFTLDLWVKFASTSGTQVIFARRTTDGGAGQQDLFALYWGSNVLTFQSAASNTDKAKYTTAWTPSTTPWYRLTVVRSGSNFYIFIDGISKSLTAATAIGTNDLTFTYAPTVDKMTLGRYGNYDGLYFNGWIDEFRWSKGLARWTANFNPLTGELV